MFFYRGDSVTPVKIKLCCNKDVMYKFLTAHKSFSAQELICPLGNKTCSVTDPKRLQKDEQTFILPPFIIYHSCNPNAYIQWSTMELKALRSVKKGDVVTYHYGTSEDDYSVGMFVCRCKAILCVGRFKGFSSMNDRQRMSIKKFISPYLLSKYYSK